MIDGILVATDASAPSNRAIDLAAEMSARYETSLVLLHVVRDMQVPPHLERLAEVEKLAGPREDVLLYVAEKILDDAERRARLRGAERIERVTGRGDPATAILAQAERSKVGLVVLGTRGLGKVKGILMGSVSRKVANLAGMNCLTVR